MKHTHFPHAQGLYDPRFEKDSCGVGFVCNIKGEQSHSLIKQGIGVLNRLAHRGAVGSDPKTGDGAGILIQMPHAFFQKAAANSKITLPSGGDYGTGLIFLPTDNAERALVKNVFAKTIQAEGQTLLGWRSVPVDNSEIGKGARNTQPIIEQVFIQKSSQLKDQLSFERKLYVIRRIIEKEVQVSLTRQKSFFYITNISCRTFSYKGLLMPHQVQKFFVDLNDKDIQSSIALVHSRYSTNTFPTWDMAQPFRFLAHNGEINTLRGNINWMSAKEQLLESPLFGADIEKLKPIITSGLSDSATIDLVLELLVLSGRSLPHAMMMLIPSAWEQNSFLSEDVRAFHRYMSCLMEPWDGPASIAFTDGTRIGAVLDRNGLRPSRYIVTKSNLVVMASEVGVLDVEPCDISYSGRLEPGKMFFIDTEMGKIIDDAEIKQTVSAQKPYREWLADTLVELHDLPTEKAPADTDQTIVSGLKAFGYTREDIKMLIRPMAQKGIEPIGSMGNDTPLAVLSNKPQLLYNYFKQLFAQVTNPAIDPIREEIVMSLECFMGPRKNLLAETMQHCRRIHLPGPILSNEDIARVKNIKEKGLKTKTISLLFQSDSKEAFRERLDAICREAEAAIRQGYTFIVLSDRGFNQAYAALPALLAVGAVHQYLVKKTCRSQIALLLESAEPREVHHFALLFGYGCGAINPYLALNAIDYLHSEEELEVPLQEGKKNYINAVHKGIKKVLSKMGISTLQSYRGAQIFEALGVGPEVIDRCFAGTVSRIGGVTFDIIAQETIIRHARAYERRSPDTDLLDTGGVYQWKRDGEFHLWNPQSIAALQDATRTNDPAKYREFSRLINDQSQHPATLRSLLKFSTEDGSASGAKKIRSLPLEEVESKKRIFKRFATGAMSFGSISRGAHETLAIAMNAIGGKSNTGEGGEDPARFIPRPNGESRRSAIKQVASGRFGVTANYLTNADELQIKIAQGAKPGEGGQLPGHKVSPTIARTRYTTPGVTLISPPPHHDIYSIEDLAQLIFDLKNTNPEARISVKLVSEIGVGTIAAGVAKGHSDMILISGGDGGTGASPKSSIRHAGLPWELGLSETHQTLVLNDLRSRVRLQTDGQMRTGRDVAIAAILGAEEFGFCTATLIIMGCVMLRHCHLNNCSVGVATQDELLQKKFQGRPEHVINYFNFVVDELREIMAELGVRSIDELVGRTELLTVNTAILPWKAQSLDLSRILYKPEVSQEVGIYCRKKQDHGIENVLDRKLIDLCRYTLNNNSEPVSFTIPIRNTERTTGAMLSGEVCRFYGEEGLLEDTIHIKFQGIAGQSFAAWLAKGITFELQGMANDYVGKGLSGGKLIIYPDRTSDYVPEKNIIIGNTTFYGAIAGEAYIRGIAGERFCIRNSGLYAVTEGVGDHGCEYMTGGRVVILGITGRNFAAGMSGGIAYVWDTDGHFRTRCNLSMVEFQVPNEEDKQLIHSLVSNHYKYTQSTVAKNVLDNFKNCLGKFVKVMPLEYKKILEMKNVGKKLGLTETYD